MFIGHELNVPAVESKSSADQSDGDCLYVLTSGAEDVETPAPGFKRGSRGPELDCLCFCSAGAHGASCGMDLYVCASRGPLGVSLSRAWRTGQGLCCYHDVHAVQFSLA